MRREVMLVHIGKTGGSSIQTYMRVNRIPGVSKALRTFHSPARRLQERFGLERFEAAEKFSIVRHPVDRFISACRMCKVDANSPETWARIEETSKLPDPACKFSILQTQYQMLYVEDELVIPKVFKFEDGLELIIDWLVEDLQLCTRRSIPHIDKGRGLGPKQVLTKESEEWVNQFYKADFEFFDYRHTTPAD